jgi:toxin ParE1/3/4
MNIRYSRRALSQLALVSEYLQQRNRSAAANVTASIRSTIARLREMPLLGKATDQAGVHVIIEPEYQYRVFYSIEDEELFVIRILHGREERT